MPLGFLVDRALPRMLAERNAVLVFSTYETGTVYFAAATSEEEIAVEPWKIGTSTGLFLDDEGDLYVGTRMAVVKLDRTIEEGSAPNQRTASYALRTAWITGDLDTHDVAVERDGRVLFVSTRFNCVATPTDDGAFAEVFRPPFVSRLVGEDRCHMNGLGLDDGRLAYVSCVSRSDVVDGWRDRRVGGGVIVDARSGDIVASGLSMPHSPRVHEGKLWILSSGTGELGTIDRASGRFEPVAFCPGFPRGLSFLGPYAFVGLSRPRHDPTFGGLPLGGMLAEKHTDARTGVHVIDTRTGQIAAWFRLEGELRELYDVAILPGIRRASALGVDDPAMATRMPVLWSRP